MNRRILAIDVEGTIIKDSLDPLPRPGLLEFLTWASEQHRLVIFSTLPEKKFREIAAALVAHGAAPEWFPRLEYFRKTPADSFKDLTRVGDPLRVWLIDDYEGYVDPAQRKRWIRIETYFDQGDQDEELARVRRDLEIRAWSYLISELPEADRKPFAQHMIDTAPRACPPPLPGDEPDDPRYWRPDYLRWKNGYYGLF